MAAGNDWETMGDAGPLGGANLGLGRPRRALGEHAPFDSLHPSVALVYLVALLGITMLAVQPVFVVVSLAAGIALSSLVRGPHATLSALRWQLPMLAVVALANPLFSASGSTLLMRLGPVAIYQESLFYGLTMGLLLAAVLEWFACAPRLLPEDRLLVLAGGALPTVALMVSMVARLVPQLVRRGALVRGVRAVAMGQGEAEQDVAEQGVPEVNGSSRARRSHRIAEGSRVSGALLGWALEDSIVTSDSMRARGWGATPHRTSYRPCHFSSRDAVALALLLVLALADAALAFVASSQFAFYPVTSRLVPWWGYLPHVALAFLPAAVCLRDRATWGRAS